MDKNRRKDDLIPDLSAPPMIADVNAKEEEAPLFKPTEAQLHPKGTITVYFRMNIDVHEHFKKLARKMSFEQNTDISYQQIIIDAALKVHPM